jgi:hypothetical protein
MINEKPKIFRNILTNIFIKMCKQMMDIILSNDCTIKISEYK